ncbi:MAG TPA: adenine nucleotide alpha hydrolase family protein [Thermoplasmatales archaeon]|nr:adenine nucleotide alpha hydrolase family protein [Thermoplasmatales archaeon]
MRRCQICRKKAEMQLKSYGIYLCNECYTSFFERRIEESIRRYKIIRRGERILIAISGGKDSVALASVLKVLSNTFELELQALYIDLGIGDYSKKAEAKSREVCRKLQIPLNVVKLGDYGFTIQDVDIKKVCSVCGNAKRYIMNRFARENGFNAIATGHNVDDILVNFFKNWLSGNKQWTEKQSPRTEGFDKMVTRIRPLFLRTEQETNLYVKIKDLPTLAEKCPNTKTDRWRGIIDEIEAKIPGFKQNFVRNLFTEGYQEEMKYGYCSRCGEMTVSKICQFCRNAERYGKQKI